MRPEKLNDWVTLYEGDAATVLGTLPDQSVNCCVTSPPYFGLRNYGVTGQIGLEASPGEYVANLVAVFREVKRVLRDDGTLWLNLGDSYAADTKGSSGVGKNATNKGTLIADRRWAVPEGLKRKDLIGIPWSIAKALQAPYYAGRITSERDRVWIAATIDAEGSICGFLHNRKDDGRTRTGIHVTITNSSTAMLDNAERIWPASRSEHQRADRAGHLGKLDIYRWIVHGVENKLLFLREIYPYLIVKRRQAMLAYNLLLLSQAAKRLGKTSQKDSANEQRAHITRLLSSANHAHAVDIPAWCIEPPTVQEPGWYLRQDIIWSKPNPMPESVTDRCTKAHEYVFLLSKRERYYFDAAAIREPAAYAGQSRGGSTNRYEQNEAGMDNKVYDTRNRRSVWTVSPKPLKTAHFATFPEELIRPMILAGCPDGGTVLDPFNGAGTTGLVSLNLNRRYVGIELNPEYLEITRRRIERASGDGPGSLFHAPPPPTLFAKGEQ